MSPRSIRILQANGSILAVPWNEISLLTFNDKNDSLSSGTNPLHVSISPAIAESKYYSAHFLIGLGLSQTQSTAFGFKGNINMPYQVSFGIQGLFATDISEIERNTRKPESVFAVGPDAGYITDLSFVRITFSFNFGAAFVTYNSRNEIDRDSRSSVTEFYYAPGLTFSINKEGMILGCGLRLIAATNINHLGLYLTAGI
ncbi:MAG: hypothetical protein HYV28_18150 [Ignavibacteriales bacterium]|nr:hypothetical protein [Ignavibacteriales bacterium]